MGLFVAILHLEKLTPNILWLPIFNLFILAINQESFNFSLNGPWLNCWKFHSGKLNTQGGFFSINLGLSANYRKQ